MSKFIDSIKAELTGRVRPKYGPLHTVIEEVPKPEDPHAQVEMTIRVIWKMKCYYSLEEPGVKKHLIDMAVRALRDEIFSDIRYRVRLLEQAIYEDDRDAMLSVARDLARETYGYL